MKRNRENNKDALEKNFKLMSISAIILLVLLGYIFFSNGQQVEGKSYYIGIIFLVVLLFIAYLGRFLRKKLIKKVPFSKFAKQMQDLTENKEDNQNSENMKELENIQAVESEIKFCDIAGISGAKDELLELVDFLNNPKKYTKFGVSLPKGVLLVGPPGVGKTLIARAVAGEASVPFFYQSGASFVHIYVGMGAKRVKELFLKARLSAPSIIFIDEIDAIGKERGVKANDEREATLNELLTQMDGFEGSSGVMVIAATNKIEMLDSALLRAGRFDRRVFIDLPNRFDREEILKLYLKKHKYDFDFEKLVSQSAGFNSAALATLINEALLNMIKRNAKIISSEDIETAKQKIEFGKREKMIFSKEQKELIAIYQASKACYTKKPLKLFDYSKDADIEYLSKTKLLSVLKGYLSGGVGISLLMGEEYAINSNDFKKAFELAKKLQREYNISISYREILPKLQKELTKELEKKLDVIKKYKEILLKNEELKEGDL